MSKSLSEQPKVVNNVDIVRHGEQLLIPETMTMEDAVELLERRIAYDAQEVAFSENFEVFPWDGANALDAVLTARYGWAPATATPSFFGPQPQFDVDPPHHQHAVLDLDLARRLAH